MCGSDNELVVSVFNKFCRVLGNISVDTNGCAHTQPGLIVGSWSENGGAQHPVLGQHSDKMGAINYRCVIDLGVMHFHIERSEEHTSELQSRFELVCRLLLEK